MLCCGFNRVRTENKGAAVCVYRSSKASTLYKIIVQAPQVILRRFSPIFQSRQKYFKTVIYKGCSSKLLLFHIQTRRTNWVSVVWKLGEICDFF